MTAIYDNAYTEKEKNIYKRMHRNYIIILCVFIFTNALSFILSFFEFMRDARIWLEIYNIVTSLAFGFYSLPFLDIKHRQTKIYYNFLCDKDMGLKEEIECVFEEYKEERVTKNGLECRVFIVKIFNDVKERTYDREIYVDSLFEFPVFEKGQKLRLITYANILLEYEIIYFD